MRVIVLFEDNPDVDPSIRKQYMAEHLLFLDRNAAEILEAGPLFNDDGTAAGGLWILEVADRAQVEHLIRADPFWPTGLRKSCRILSWKRVFGGGARLI
jgi:hypothetical protein